MCTAVMFYLASGVALAAPAWTCGSWMDGFTPAENNIARGLVPAGVGNSGYLLTDGQAEVGANRSGINTVEIGSGKTLTFTFDSPAVDAGSWALIGDTKAAVKAMLDLNGDPRLVGGEIDIGCYERVSTAFLLFLQ